MNRFPDNSGYRLDTGFPAMSELEQQFFDALVLASFIAAGVVFVVLFFVHAPYGRHLRAGWGPTIANRTGWMIMETPAVLAIAACFFWGNGLEVHPGALALLFLWELHYIHRAFVFPFRISPVGKRMPLSIVAMAIVFNLSNGYLNGRYLGLHAGDYGPAWLAEPRFIAGTIVFLFGLGINLHSDRILLSLRKPGETGYKIPRGGLFRWVSCPNYLSECVQWTGWAIATWSIPGLLFAVWTAANLVPRAHAHHRWYKETFEDYPADRKAIVPYIF